MTMWVRAVMAELHSPDELFLVWAGPAEPAPPAPATSPVSQVVVTSTTSTKLPPGQARSPSPVKDVGQIMSPDWCMRWIWFKGKKADQTQWKAGDMTRVGGQHFTWRIEENMAYFSGSETA